MKSEITFEDWQKIEMIVGEIMDTNDGISINLGDKILKSKIKLNAKKEDKIVIGFLNNQIIIPVVDKNNPIVPEKDIENGSRIG